MRERPMQTLQLSKRMVGIGIGTNREEQRVPGTIITITNYDSTKSGQRRESSLSLKQSQRKLVC